MAIMDNLGGSGGSGGTNSNIYSTTEEIIVGTWIDGKPIYRKVIEGTLPAATTNGTAVTSKIDLANLNLEKLVSLVAIAKRDSNSMQTTLPFFSSDKYTIMAYVKENSLTFSNEIKTYNNTPVVSILEYTKTTD